MVSGRHCIATYVIDLQHMTIVGTVTYMWSKWQSKHICSSLALLIGEKGHWENWQSWQGQWAIMPDVDTLLHSLQWLDIHTWQVDNKDMLRQYKGNGCVGPILDERLKKKIMKAWKGMLCIHFRVCLFVCLYAGYRSHLLEKIEISDPFLYLDIFGNRFF